MDNKNVLITGASGFVGKACVAECIKRGWNVIALIHSVFPNNFSTLGESKRLSIIYGDVSKKDTLIKGIENYLVTENKHIDAIVHCAAYASDIGPKKVFESINYEGVKNIVTCLNTFSINKLIFISTTDVYGMKDFNNADENISYDNNLNNFYPEYKIEAEKFIKNELKKEQYVILRPGAVWGPGDTTILPRIVQFLKSTPFLIHFGKWKGMNRLPLAYIENLAKAVYLSIIYDDVNGESINVIDSEKTTIDEFYRILIKIFFPQKEKMKTITIPFFCGYLIGIVSTFLSNIFRCKSPLFEPTLYSLYSVSKNLYFNSNKMEKLFRKYGEKLINKEEGIDDLKKWAIDKRYCLLKKYLTPGQKSLI